MKLIVAITGSSGVIYGIRLLEKLADIPEVETHLIISNFGKVTVELETDYAVRQVEGLADVVHNNRNQAASISSGSFLSSGMIIAPCSMKSLSAIAHSYSDNLVARAADVTLKERRPLVLVPRESPLHLGHCELMLKAAQLGAIVAPPMPAFYIRPQSIDDLIDHTVGRVLDLVGIRLSGMTRWEGSA